MKIRITNPSPEQEEATFLTSDYSSGTTLTVRNSDDFTTSWFAVIGKPGQEQTEAKQISATPTATTITISGALNFSHGRPTPVFKSQWDKVSFERKPVSGSYSEVSGSPFDIDWDDPDLSTLIFISNGVSTDTYKWRFYNSALGTYSDYSDELAGTGLTRYKVGYLIQQVKKNPMAGAVDDESIIDYFNDFQDKVYDEMPKAWWFSKEGTAIATTADAFKFSISTNWSDFFSVNYVLYRYVNGSTDETYPLTFEPPQSFYNFKSDANQASDDYARYWTFYPPDGSSDKGYIAIHPTSDTTACYVKPVYFFELTRLDSFGDTVVIPYPKGYIDYALYRIFDDLLQDGDNAVKFDGRVKSDLKSLRIRAKRQKGQHELFRFRGVRAWSRMFGEGGMSSSSTSVENNW